MVSLVALGGRKSDGGVVLSVEHVSQRAAAAVFARCGRSGSNAAVALVSFGRRSSSSGLGALEAFFCIYNDLAETYLGH